MTRHPRCWEFSTPPRDGKTSGTNEKLTRATFTPPKTTSIPRRCEAARVFSCPTSLQSPHTLTPVVAQDGGSRRINWGWATVPPASTQTLPREITFNAAARVMQQYPIDELKALRGAAASSKSSVSVGPNPVALGLASGVTKMSEVVAVFSLPKTATTFGIQIGKPSAPTPPSSGKTVGLRMYVAAIKYLRSPQHVSPFSNFTLGTERMFQVATTMSV